jgi:hypothetical protein
MNSIANGTEFGGTSVPPKLTESQNRRPWLLLSGVLVVAAACVILFLFNPSQHGFYPPCYFHELTGMLCPGCGSSRAMHQLLHGHVGAAIRCNALLMACLPLAAGFAIRFAVKKIKNQPAVLSISPAGLWLLLAVTVVFAVLRNLPTFSWLAP